MLTRLEEKGVVEGRIRGNTAFYTPLVERKEARFSALKSLVDTAFDGTLGTMMHFLVSNEEIPEKDRAEILRLIRERKHQEGKDK
jgi:predicted transcriptional regulator